MNHHENLKIIAFVGMSGSGKSTALDYFTEKGIPKVDFSTIPYEMMSERGIAKGEENEKEFRVNIRAELGDDIYAKRVIEQIHHLAGAGQHRIVLGGLYSWDEYKTLKHEFPGELTFVAIVAPKHKRYQWLASRDDRPQTHEVSSERDHNEIQDIQKGGPIAAADYYVLNDGSVKHFQDQIDAITREIEF